MWINLVTRQRRLICLSPLASAKVLETSMSTSGSLARELTPRMRSTSSFKVQVAQTTCICLSWTRSSSHKRCKLIRMDSMAPRESQPRRFKTRTIKANWRWSRECQTSKAILSMIKGLEWVSISKDTLLWVTMLKTRTHRKNFKKEWTIREVVRKTRLDNHCLNRRGTTTSCGPHLQTRKERILAVVECLDSLTSIQMP